MSSAHFCKAYYKEHGNLDVKARYVTDSGFRLGRWVCNLRTKVKNKGLDQALTKEQQGELEKLGMIWDRNGEKWEEYFREAQRYYLEHGELEVPVKYVTENGVPLPSGCFLFARIFEIHLPSFTPFTLYETGTFRFPYSS